MPTGRHRAVFLTAALAAVALAGARLAAQEDPAAPEPRDWRWFAESGVGPTTDPVVADAITRAKGFIAAGVKDGEHPNWCCRAFLTEQSLDAAPLHFLLVRDGPPDDRAESVYMQWDYEKAIDFAEMFAPMDPKPLGGDNAYHVRGMQLRSVQRPDGGFRMNFGRRGVFGDDPAQSPLFAEYTTIEVKPRHTRLLARLRQMPIFASVDLHPVMSSRERRAVAGLFGPKAALLSGSVTQLGGRPVVDLYSAMDPGEGLVGQYMAPQPGNAGVLGALPFPPAILVAADLGETLPRSLLTLMRAAPRGSEEAIETLRPLLESWDGSLTIAATGRKLPAEPAEADTRDVLVELARSLRGTIALGIGDGTGEELAKGLLDLLRRKDSRWAADIEPVGAGDQQAFRVLRAKFVAIGGSEDLLVFSVADDRQSCLAWRDACLAGSSGARAPTPKELGLVLGPVKLWVHQDMLRYVGAYARGMARVVAGRSVQNRADWIVRTLETELPTHHLAVSLSWTRRFGVMLRAMF